MPLGLKIFKPLKTKDEIEFSAKIKNFKNCAKSDAMAQLKAQWHSLVTHLRTGLYT
jgi:hypothetical protein